VIRFVLLNLLTLFVCNVSIAQFPSLEGYMVSDISTITFSYSGTSGKGKNKTEVPPWIIPGGLKSYFFVDGSDTYIWSSASSLVHDRTLELDQAVGPSLASASYIHTPNFHSSNKVKNWKRNYHAIYSAAYIDHPVRGPVSIGFLHGENKNQVVGNLNGPLTTRYQNTIQENVTINPTDHESYSGGEPFREGWNAYNAMISAAWTPNNAGTNWGQQFFNNELGPIAWPSTAYITVNGIKCTSGLKHPSSIIAGGYVYVFYTDGGPFRNNIHQERGREEGVKVVRAPVAAALDPKAYAVYYKDQSGRESWLPSLPNGFTKETMLDFVAVQGPKSSDIMNDSAGMSQEIRFSVAKVRNKDYFIGVEEYIDVADSKKFKVALRFSKDLTTWTERALIVHESTNWNTTQMNYPIFLDKEGWSNTEIDIDDFYILGTGTSPQKQVNKIHLKSFITVGQLISSRPFNPSQSTPDNLVYPNPNNGSFRLSYNLDEPSRVRISLLNTNGRSLGVLKNVVRNYGRYSEVVDIHTYPAGTYLVEMSSNTQHMVYKIIKQ